MMYRLFFIFFVTACATNLPETKEWNDKYNPADWREQFELCKDKFYTNYPEEIKQEEWHECMSRDYESTV